MRNVDRWHPSKFEMHRGRWRASRDVRQVGLTSRLMVDRIADAYTSALTRHASGHLLDLGCGHVPLFAAYRTLVDTVTCADWPQTLHPSPHLDNEIDLSEPLPWPAHRFDTVLLTDVLEHLPYPERLWQELARVLRPGGKVIVGVPFMYWLHEEPHDYYRYTEHRLRRFCEDNGFSVLQCRSYGGATDTMADIACKGLGRSPFTKWTVRPLTLIASRVGASRIGVRDPLPLGYLLIAQRERE